MVPRLFEVTRDRVAVERVGGVRFCASRLSRRGDGASWRSTRWTVFSRLSGSCCRPLVLVAGLAVLVVLGRPVLLRGAAGGPDGRVFGLIKLRTLPRATPCVTAAGPVAAFLRWMSLDELPSW